MGGREERVVARRGLRELWKWKREEEKGSIESWEAKRKGRKIGYQIRVSGVGGRTGR